MQFEKKQKFDHVTTLFREIESDQISQVTLLYEFPNRVTGEIYEVMANIVASNMQWTRKFGLSRFRGNTNKNKALSPEDAVVLDDTSFSDYGSDEEYEAPRELRNYDNTRNIKTRTFKDETEQTYNYSPDAKRKAMSPASAATNTSKKTKKEDMDKKMPARTTTITQKEEDDWKKDIKEMAKAIQSLVHAQVKTDAKVKELEQQQAKEKEIVEDNEDFEDDDDPEVDEEVEKEEEKKNI